MVFPTEHFSFVPKKTRFGYSNTKTLKIMLTIEFYSLCLRNNNYVCKTGQFGRRRENSRVKIIENNGAVALV
jgi:hypothetical protein